MAITSYGDITPRVAIKAIKKLLKFFQPAVITQRFGQVEKIRKHDSFVAKWRRYDNFAISTAPLQEGVTPKGHTMTYTDVTGTLKQYGDKAPLTDVVSETHQDPIMDEMIEKTAEQAAQVIELVTIEILKAGTNVVYSNQVASRVAVNTAIVRGDVRLAVRALDRSDAKPISRIVAPSAKISTVGVEKAYYAMCNTDLKPDLRNMTGFKTVVEYGSPGMSTAEEFGAMEETRFLCTSNFGAWEEAGTDNSGQSVLLTAGSSGTGSPDVYPILIVGRDAYGIVRLQGHDRFKLMVLQPNVPRGGDELGQLGYVSWKTWYTAAILNETYMVRIEVGCTANPV